MPVQYWEYPVDLEFHGVENRRTITATCFACECLLTHWPEHHGPAYRKALSVCLEAMKGKAPQAAARRAFLEAAAEASLLRGMQ